MKYGSVFVLLLSITSCSNPSSDASEPGDTVTGGPTQTVTATTYAIAPDSTVTCYRYDRDIEHHWMKMTRIGDTVYGELNYTWEGKDGANGTFHGKFSGDTLWILFNSYGEGEYIDLERAYLLSGEKLLEGQGMQESNEAGNYYYFKHKKLIEFSEKEFLVKGPCM